jgi:predicted PhzF superfamily epimerase YddE/YHI9
MPSGERLAAVSRAAVPGSAHCALQPYWHSRVSSDERQWVTALQASPRRGIVQVRGYTETRPDGTSRRRVQLRGGVVLASSGWLDAGVTRRLLVDPR